MPLYWHALSNSHYVGLFTADLLTLVRTAKHSAIEQPIRATPFSKRVPMRREGAWQNREVPHRARFGVERFLLLRSRSKTLH
jgi:hypothetical protein